MHEHPRAVKAYLKTVPAEHRPVLSQLLVFCRALLPEHDESLRFGMPTYSRHGSAELAFVSDTSQIVLYLLRKDVAERYRAELSDLEPSCIRYTELEAVDFDLIERVLQTTASPPLRR